MIYILRATKLNKDNAEILAKSNFTGQESDTPMEIRSNYKTPLNEPIVDQDKVLILLDLTANKAAQWRDPKEFANQLLKNGALTNYVEDIYLMISEVDPEKSLHKFAREMTEETKKITDRNIPVHLPGIIGYESTLIVPPTKTDGKTWQVYCLKNIPKNANAVSDHSDPDKQIDDLMRHENKKLVWESTDGSALKKWMDDSLKIYKPAIPMVLSSSLRP